MAALLDSAAVPPNEHAGGQSISPPPKFKFTAGDKAHLPAPNGTPRGSTPKSRGRPRAGSPAKSASPVKSSGKKPRETKKQKEAANAAAAKEASAALHSTLADAVSSASGNQVNGDTVKVDIETTVEAKGDTETTTTNVIVEMPKGSPDLPLPENPEKMIETAKKMVDEAKKIDKAEKSKSKRKAEVLEDDDDLTEADGELPPAKRARLAEQKLKRERVRNRALVGVAATLAIGYEVIHAYRKPDLTKFAGPSFLTLPVERLISKA